MLQARLNPRDIANALPDSPRWVEIRSMLLSNRANVFGLDLDAAPTPSFAVVKHDVGVVGAPNPKAILEAVQHSGEAAIVLAVPENLALVEAALPHWISERAALHTLASLNRLPEVPPGIVRLLEPGETTSLKNVPEDLYAELADAVVDGAAIAAAFADGQPVSFCYAGSETEGLWDISIDTLEPYWRQGHAARCVAFQIARYRERGKAPVWGSLRSNLASARLAAKLGFVEVDEICVLTPPPSF